MKRALVLVSLLGLLASGCVGLVQIGKGPLQVGQPRATPTPAPTPEGVR